MKKPHGVQSEITNFPFKDLHETFYNQDGIEVETKDGVLFVGVDDKNRLEEAKDLARLYLAAWSERQNIKTKVDFNHSWQTNPQGNKHYNLEFKENVKLTEHLQIQTTTHQVSIQGKAFIVTQQMHDSASFTNDETKVKKAQKYPALKSALFYFSEEVIDDERPLYGVYKALEAIISYLQATYNLDEKEARKKLAGLVGQPFSYVDDIIQTTQVKRHHITPSKKRINDDECRNRAKILIDAFANALS